MEPFGEATDPLQCSEDILEINSNLRLHTKLSQNMECDTNIKLELKLEPIDPLECSSNSHEIYSESQTRLEIEQSSCNIKREETDTTVDLNTKCDTPLFGVKKESTSSNVQLINIPIDVLSFTNNEKSCDQNEPRISKEIQSDNKVNTCTKRQKLKSIRYSSISGNKSKRSISIESKLSNNESNMDSTPKKLRNKKTSVSKKNGQGILCKCGRRSTCPDRILLHKFSFIEGKPFKCDKCLKMFSCLHNLSKHKYFTHSMEKRYECSECGEKFSRFADLTNHSILHTGVKERLYQCDECDKSFSRSNHLKQHKMIHSGEKPFQCTQCEKSFSRLQTLIQHNLTHTNEKPFKCLECDKSYVNTHQLNLHKQIHTGERPHQCDVCSKAFSRPYELKMHKALHSGVKQFKCNKCDKSYSRGYTLNKHMISCHDGDMDISV